MVRCLSGEVFTPDEQRILSRHFTNTDQSVFAIFNLPEIVKGALFARYSRSSKSLRRLFLDEFYKTDGAGQFATGANETESGVERARDLYNRVFNEYGDDSVAQLGAAHIAFENVSNVLTKVLERGRLASYLEQSTRYINYGTKLNGAYRYKVPPELHNTDLEGRYVLLMDGLFGVYQRIVEQCIEYFKRRYPQTAKISERAWEISIRAQAYDVARGVLPASTISNVGVFASGQAFERLLLRLKASPLKEAQECADVALVELRKVIPDFLKRVDVENRGVAWVNYLKSSRQSASEAVLAHSAGEHNGTERAEVELVKWDADGEQRLAAAILYEHGEYSLKHSHELARELSAGECAELITKYCAGRSNRRHMPGRAFESTNYQFDIVADYGSFRDLQRHRIMSIEWQPLTTRHGFITPDVLTDNELRDAHEQWNEAMVRSAEFYEEVRTKIGALQAQYVVPFAYKINYTIGLNARQAFHFIELRSSEQGHENYRKIVLAMHKLIREQAGHQTIADAMKFVNTDEIGLARLTAAQKTN